MIKTVLVSLTLLALTAPAALAGTEFGQITPETNRELVNSQTGGPVERLYRPIG